MGLDVAFDRQSAISAGLIVTTEQQGTREEILAELELDNPHPGVLKHLESFAEVVEVPGTDLRVQHLSGHHSKFIVRANRWGHVYRPLTDWLMLNNIDWDEF